MFLHEQIQLSLAAIEQAGGHIKAIICDGNRNNQAFFQLLGANWQRPWETQAGVYLLYDYGHILKNIRNNRLTEATGQLSYYHDGVWRTAMWNHLVELYKLEADSLVKMSTLDEVSVLLKPKKCPHVSKSSVKRPTKLYSNTLEWRSLKM
ncbi:transposable element p transposase [Plakobranchus ocellatus]|uniref:Transposable element p transposase n=1 Tax=Plakobranchus ocellatus TaxID=259542 RepID=A0AAV4CUU2_9GAST|nr:transposable element p transposase [Plakobranchus ocellatus]